MRHSTLAALLATAWLGCDAPLPDGPGPDSAVSSPDGDVGDGTTPRDGDVGVDAGWAGVPQGPLPCHDVSFYGPVVSRISWLEMSGLGVPGSGLDVDGDPSTCRPTGRCHGGIDNQLALLDVTCTSIDLRLEVFNDFGPPMMLTNPQKPLIWLIEAVDLFLDGRDSLAPFQFRMFAGSWEHSAECDQVDDLADPSRRCEYLVTPTMFEPGTCDPLILAAEAEIVDAHLTAGGPGYHLFGIEPFGDTHVGLSFHHARIEAELVFYPTSDGTGFYVESGVMAGAICPWDFANMVYDLFTSTDPAQCDVQAQLPDPDIEAGCDDGSPDAISMGIQFATVPAQIVGYDDTNAP